MSKENCSTLVKCINEVTNSAVGFDADSLRFPVEWLFHFRWSKKPGNVNGKKIEFITAGGRTTAYVPELQKLCGDQAVKEASKPSKGINRGNPDDDVEKLGNEDESTNSKVVKCRKISGAKKLLKKLSSNAENSDDANDKYSKKTSTANKHPKESSPSVVDSVNDKDGDDKSFKKTSIVKKPSNKKLSPKVEGLDNSENDSNSVDRSKQTRGPKNPTTLGKTNENDTENQRKQTRGKNSAKRNREESNDKVSSCSESGDDYEDKVDEEINRKQRKGTSSAKKMAEYSQSRKQQRTKAK